MTTVRVSTFVSTSTLFSQTQRLQSKYALASQQASSGLKADAFEGIAQDSQKLLTFNNESSDLTAYKLSIKSSKIRAQTMQARVTTFGETVNKATQLFASVLSGLNLVGGAPASVAQATVLRDELVGLLNSQIGGNYLFSGSAYNVLPVDISNAAYTPSAAPGTPDIDYYNGNNALDSVRASEALQITYGVTADSSGFEKALRALTIFINDPTNVPIVQQAFTLTKESAAEVGDINGLLTAKVGLLIEQEDVHNASQEYLEQFLSGLRDADLGEVSIIMSQTETQLQASYSALSKLLQLRLTDFLR